MLPSCGNSTMTELVSLWPLGPDGYCRRAWCSQARPKAKSLHACGRAYLSKFSAGHAVKFLQFGARVVWTNPDLI
jgi:hypothetical protein